jgi:hypothetical protein
MEGAGAAGHAGGPTKVATWVAVSVVIVLVVAAFVFVIEGGLGTSQAPATRSTSFSATSMGIRSPNNGLRLILTLNSSSISAGGGIAATVDEVNTMTSPNNVSASESWPIGELALGPCGSLNYPVGLAVFRGNYDTTNASSGKALQLYRPGLSSCPMILAGIGSFVFQASSDNATIFAGSCRVGNGCLNEMVYSTVSISGYWSETPQGAVFTGLPIGSYTVVAGDEWGDIAVLHFVVTGSGA